MARHLKTHPFLLILFTAFSLSPAAAANRFIGRMNRLLPRLEGHSLGEIKRRLDQTRLPALTAADRETIFDDLPFVTPGNLVHDEALIARLRRRIYPVLAYHRRENIIIVVFNDSRPIAITRRGGLIALSTALLDMLPTDEELMAVVAHEMGHIYVAVDFTYATRAGDMRKLRRLELYCDSIAVATLTSLKINPHYLARALARVYNHPSIASHDSVTNTHPTLVVRVSLIDRLGSTLRTGTAGAAVGAFAAAR
jgi:Zn-dependent protease with chaperone function